MHPRHARAGENRSRVENRSRAEDEGQYESVHFWEENKTPQVKSSQVCFLCIDLT